MDKTVHQSPLTGECSPLDLLRHPKVFPLLDRSLFLTINSDFIKPTIQTSVSFKFQIQNTNNILIFSLHFKKIYLNIINQPAFHTQVPFPEHHSFAGAEM